MDRGTSLGEAAGDEAGDDENGPGLSGLIDLITAEINLGSGW